MPSPDTLNDDIRLLGRTLGDVIADQAGSATLDLVEAIRRAAVGDADPARLIDLLDPLQIADALHVIRAFSYFAMLANIAEDTDHSRRRRALVQAGAAAPASVGVAPIAATCDHPHLRQQAGPVGQPPKRRQRTTPAFQ